MATINSRWAAPANQEDRSYWEQAQGLARRLPDNWLVICGLASSGWSLPAIIRGPAGVAVARSDAIEDGSRYLQLALFLEHWVEKLEGLVRPTAATIPADAQAS